MAVLEVTPSAPAPSSPMLRSESIALLRENGYDESNGYDLSGITYLDSGFLNRALKLEPTLPRISDRKTQVVKEPIQKKLTLIDPTRQQEYHEAFQRYFPQAVVPGKVLVSPDGTASVAVMEYITGRPLSAADITPPRHVRKRGQTPLGIQAEVIMKQNAKMIVDLCISADVAAVAGVESAVRHPIRRKKRILPNLFVVDEKRVVWADEDPLPIGIQAARIPGHPVQSLRRLVQANGSFLVTQWVTRAMFGLSVPRHPRS